MMSTPCARRLVKSGPEIEPAWGLVLQPVQDEPGNSEEEVDRPRNDDADDGDGGGDGDGVMVMMVVTTITAKRVVAGHTLGGDHGRHRLARPTGGAGGAG